MKTPSNPTLPAMLRCPCCHNLQLSAHLRNGAKQTERERVREKERKRERKQEKERERKRYKENESEWCIYLRRRKTIGNPCETMGKPGENHENYHS